MKPIRTAYFTLATALAVLVAAAAPTSAFAEGSNAHRPLRTPRPVTTVQLFSGLSGPVSGSDQNIWTNILVPMFEKTHPGIKVNVTFSGSSDQAILDRIIAGVKAGQPSPYDIVDQSDIMVPLQTLHDGVRLTTKQIPLMSRVNPLLLKQTGYQALPYRGSTVVLAYNSSLVKHPPTTIPGLLAWIRQNPGKFTYCTPDSGGSGASFVQTIVNRFVAKRYESTMINGYKPALEKVWQPGLKYLASLEPDIYRTGYYPNGNSAVLTLLANSSIWMAPVWSDMATNSLRLHQLPPSIKLLQLTPSFDGGPADLLIPVNSSHKAAAEVFMNWLLTPQAQQTIVNRMGGYPGVEAKYAPPAVRRQFAGILKTPPSMWWSSDFGHDLAKKWQSQVAAQK